MSVSPVGQNTPHLFLALDENTRREVSSALFKQKTLLFSSMVNDKTNLAHALAYMRWEAEGKKQVEPYTDENIEQIIKLLDDAAFPKIPEENPAKQLLRCNEAIEAWKKRVNILTTCAQDFKILSSVAKGGALCAVGMGVLYRSHKILLVANLCAACALAIVSRFGAGLALSHEELKVPLDGLSVQNLGEFEVNLGNACQEAKKVNVLVRLYFSHLQKGLIGQKKNQVFFDEYLFSLSQAKLLLNQLNKTLTLFKVFKLLRSILSLNIFEILLNFSALFQSTNGEYQNTIEQKKTNSDDVKQAFQRLYKICSVGAAISGGFTILNGALTYHAFMQRAYLMVLAGLVQAIGLSMLTYELVKVSLGSKKVSSGEDIPKDFANLLSQSKLIKAMSYGYEVSTESDIEQVIVIPFEAIIKLAKGYQFSAKA